MMVESVTDTKSPILVVDDDKGLLSSMEAIICSAGMPRPALLSDSRHVMDMIRKYRFQLVFLDLIMPRISGMELLEIIKREYPDTECIIITALDEVPKAVQAMQFGAFDYLVKPVDRQKLLISIRNALEKYGLRHGLAPFSTPADFSDLKHPEAFSHIICKDEKMIRILHQAEIAAMSDYNLMITGETGTGKELIAKAIHKLSRRSDGPFVPINISSVNPGLFEDFFFGHSKGAYTGAVQTQKGFLESAQGGSLFLDEIAELDKNLQVKLLRAIEQKQICRIGSTDFRQIDVRFIAATNLEPEKEIREQRFRADLFYRLSVFHIHIPPLRERRKDILPLARHFLDIHSRKNKKKIFSMTAEFENCLEHYGFPGNVRELENLIATAVLGENGNSLTLSSAPQAVEKADVPHLPELLPLRELEKRHILQVLEAAEGNRTHAAKILEIGLRTLRRKLKEYGVNPSDN